MRNHFWLAYPFAVPNFHFPKISVYTRGEKFKTRPKSVQILNYALIYISNFELNFNIFLRTKENKIFHAIFLN